MDALVTIQHTGDAKVAQYYLRMLLITEEEVAGFDILMDDIAVMTISKCGSSLQGNTAELIEVTIQIIVRKRTSSQILHQLIVTILTIYISLAIIVNLHDSLHAKTLDNPQQCLLDGEVRIIYLQHHLLLVALDQKNLCLTRIVTETFKVMVNFSFDKKITSSIGGSRFVSTWNICSISGSFT